MTRAFDLACNNALTRRLWTLALATCTLVAAWTGCGRSEPSDPPDSDQPRYVVLSPALAIMLRDLGQEDRIVARHAYDLVLDESLPVAGELGRIDYEALIAARPTHVLIEWGAMTQALPDRLEELARQRDLEIMRFELLTLDDIVTAVDRLEEDLPASDLGPDPGYWQARMRDVWGDGSGRLAPRNDPVSAGRVLILAATDPVIAATGPGSWHYQILEALGATPAITSGAPWMELSPEDVVRLAPDAILLIQPRGRDEPEAGWASPDDVLALLGPVARLDIPAVRSRRVALIDDPLAHTPSTAMVGLTDQVASVLRAWAATPAEGGPVSPGNP